jgi:hypothetical protein
MRKVFGAALAAVFSALMLVGTSTGSVAAPATAAAAIEGCGDGYFCFYHNSDFEGARADYWYSDGDLGDETFDKGGTNGRGHVVKNDAAGAVNNWAYSATVYYNSGCNGSYATQTFAPHRGANFSAVMKNENASFKWLGGGGPFTDCDER